MGSGNAPAAEKCAGLIDGGFMDWYLSSRIELDMMYENIDLGNALGLGNVGGFDKYSGYWSSTESVNGLSAWRQKFFFGNQNYGIKFNPARVRAVRAF